MAERIKKKLRQEFFIENTTIHGIYYLNKKNKHQKLLWLFLTIASTILIGLSTILMTLRYVDYDDYMITQLTEMNEYSSLPSILICLNDKLSLVDTIAEIDSEAKKAFTELKTKIELEHVISMQFSTILQNNSLYLNTLMNELFFENLKTKYLKLKKVINDCEIMIDDKTLIKCTKSASLLFTINGPCLLINLKTHASINNSSLTNRMSLINPYDKYSIKVYATIDTKKPIYFSLINADADDYNDALTASIYSSEFNKALFIDSADESLYEIFDVKTVIEQYTETLYNKKCFKQDNRYLKNFQSYTEHLCHIDCLQSLILHILKCDFTLNVINQTATSRQYCKIVDLLAIEKIIKNYSFLRKSFEICKPCLPGCLIKKYELEVNYEPRIIDPYSTFYYLKFNFDFKMIQIKQILKFELSEYLQFINGLWSLFLGISLLSIWELIEFIYTILFNKYFQVNKFNQACFIQYFNKLDKIMKKVFHNTYDNYR